MRKRLINRVAKLASIMEGLAKGFLSMASKWFNPMSF
jgi:hypothetical protein